MDDWIAAGADTRFLPDPPCGLGWRLLGGVWALSAVAGVVAAALVDRLTRRHA